MQLPRAGFPDTARPLHTRLPPEALTLAPRARRRRIAYWDGDFGTLARWSQPLATGTSIPTPSESRASMPRSKNSDLVQTAALATKAEWIKGEIALWGYEPDGDVVLIDRLVPPNKRRTCRLGMRSDRVTYPSRDFEWTAVHWCPAEEPPPQQPPPQQPSPKPNKLPSVHLPYAQAALKQRQALTEQAVRAVMAEGLPTGKEFDRQVRLRLGLKPDARSPSRWTIKRVHTSLK